MTLTPKVRQIAFGVYVAIRNSGDAYRRPDRGDGVMNMLVALTRTGQVQVVVNIPVTPF